MRLDYEKHGSDFNLIYIFKDGQGTSFQRTKYMVLFCLEALYDSPKQASVLQLVYEIQLLSRAAIASCLSRMATGYCRPGLPHYKRRYVRRISRPRERAAYRILEKGEHFLQKINQTRPSDADTWTNELIQARKERDELREYLRSKYGLKFTDTKGPQR